MEFGRLVVRGAGYLRGESLAELEAIGERLLRRPIRRARVSGDASDCMRIRPAATPWRCAPRR